MLQNILTEARTHALWEACKELGRLVLIGAVSGALAGATQAIGLITDPIWVVSLGAFLTVVGKAWDKYVHKADNGIETGITGF